MIGLALLLLFAGAVIALAPETAVGKGLRRHLVEEPARLLNRGPLEVFVAVFVVVGFAAFMIGAPELIAIAGGAADFALVLDAAALFLVFGGVGVARTARIVAVRLARGAGGGLVLVRRSLARSRERRPRAHKPRRPRSDDYADPFGAWAPA